MPDKKIEISDIVKAIQQGTPAASSKKFTSFRDPNRGYEGARFDVPSSAIFDRLNDGSLVAKYQNYSGATGNEERLAQQQSGGEQLLYGVTKNLLKVGTYALDNTVGTAYGILKAASTGEFSKLYDNDFGKAMDDANKKLDNNLPNYYTEEQKSQGLLKSLGSINFWANDVMGGMAFVGGALLPGALMTLATGGAAAPSLAVGIGKRLLKSGLKAGLKSSDELIEAGVKAGIKSADDVLEEGASLARKAKYYQEADKGLNVFKSWQRAILGKKVGDVASTAGFLARTSAFEAGMEARQNLKTSMDSFYENFQAKNGRPPELEDIQDFSEKATKAANSLFVANMGILAVSNAVMFGKTLGVVGPNTIKSINNFGNKLIGLGAKSITTGVEAGTLVARTSNRLQRNLGRAYKILEKPISEGIYEEGFQGVASKTMQDYLEQKYDPSGTHGYDMLASLSDAFAKQYGTNEGWKEMGVGMLVGFMGGTVQGEGLPGFGKNSYAAAVAKTQQDIVQVNTGVEKLKGLQRASSARMFANRVEGVDQTSSQSNAISNTEFIKSQEGLKSPKEIKEDFKAVIENTDLHEDVVRTIGESNVEQYKADLISEFDRHMEDYQFAKKAVASVGLDKVLKDTPGKINEIGEALTMNLVLGKHALYSAQNIGQQLGKLIGKDGLFDHLEYYNNLTEESKNKVAELKAKQEEVNKLEATAIQLGQTLTKIQETKKGNKELVDTVYNKTAEKMAITAQQTEKLNAEIESLNQSLSKDFRAANFNPDGSVSIAGISNNTKETIDVLDKLDEYKDALRDNGRHDVADTISTLLSEFKKQSDAHRETNNLARRMMDTNFFSSKEGTSLLTRLTGKPYTMSPEFRQVLRDNDEFIDRSMNMMNVRGTDAIEKEFEKILEGNPELSDREKYRLESLIRLQLTQNHLQEQVEKDILPASQIIVQQETTPSPLEGDTIVLAQQVELRSENVTPIEALDKAIKDITDQINYVVNRPDRNKSQIENLQQDLDRLLTLKQERDATQKSEQQQQESGEQSSEPEHQGAGERQQENGEGQGSQREGTPDEANNSDSNQSSEEEVIPEKDQLQEDIDNLQAKLDELSKPFKIIDTEEYKRYAELVRKKESDTELTDDEEQELIDLKEDINQWLLITGTVANGLRLSDLIRQREALAVAEVEPLEDVIQVTPDDTLGGADFVTVNRGNANYSLPQSPDAAVATVRHDKNIIVSHIDIDELEELAGQSIPLVEGSDAQKNFVISQDTVQQINENPDSKVSIMPTNEDMSSSYSFLIEYTVDVNGNSIGIPLRSPMTDYNGQMDTDHLYDIAKEDKITLSVDPNDEWNIKLMDEYREAKGKDRKAILEELKKSMVIRVNHNGVFCGVLKAKNNRTKALDGTDEKFEMLRDAIVEREGLLEALDGNTEIFLDEHTISITQIKPGHPTFLMSRNDDGSVSINATSFDAKMADKVEDIGYIEEGSITTRSAEKGLDTTFLSKYADRRPKGKVPFVVIRKGNTRIAYPIKIKPQEKKDDSDFEKIFNSDSVSPTQKVIDLNKFMAKRGIDVKEAGNAFFTSNLTQEFFDEKMQQLEAINYYSPLTEWVKPDSDMKKILQQQALINIDLSNPFHSPKMVLNFSEVYAGITLPDLKSRNANSSNLTTKNSTTKSLGLEALEEMRKNC